MPSQYCLCLNCSHSDSLPQSISNDGTKFYLTTDKDAPMYRIVQFELADPQKGMQDFIPEDKDAHLETISAVDNDKFVIVYKRNVCSFLHSHKFGYFPGLLLQVIDELYIYSSNGKRVERLAADFVGKIDVTGVKREHSSFFATLSGFTTPGMIQMYDFKASLEPKWTVYKTTKVNGLITEDFIVEQVRVTLL